eukprot:TRINITY_DN93658_c0_g1_i1.p1 TRINITY_DN93658_c0_g1~~TRINITY_DN93658_c0_g1_i1.p1  ORF type:complete len:238 (+),score=38.10 TRINITY_DN93658_c0_g1_i1:133-846(+)
MGTRRYPNVCAAAVAGPCALPSSLSRIDVASQCAALGYEVRGSATRPAAAGTPKGVNTKSLLWRYSFEQPPLSSAAAALEVPRTSLQKRPASAGSVGSTAASTRPSSAGMQRQAHLPSGALQATQLRNARPQSAPVRHRKEATPGANTTGRKRPTTAERKLMAVEEFLRAAREPPEPRRAAAGTAFARSYSAGAAKAEGSASAPMMCCLENAKWRDGSDSHALGHKRFERAHNLPGF